MPATAAEAGFRNCLTIVSDCIALSSDRARECYCTSHLTLWDLVGLYSACRNWQTAQRDQR